MSALGQKQTYAMHQPVSALHPIATAKADISPGSCPLYPRKQTCAVQLAMSALGHKRTCALFDHLVGCGKQRLRNIEPAVILKRMVGSMFTITIRPLAGVTNPDKALRSALKLPSLYSLIDVQRNPNLRSITTLLVANNEKDELYHAAQDDTHCRCFASSPI
jgi:hypothetical protein